MILIGAAVAPNAEPEDDRVVAATLVAGAEGFANAENGVVELEDEEAPVANAVENEGVVFEAEEEVDEAVS
ncbi:hypothetical protein SESBI_01690 [Sesbania bispinosa]|nr:hypothetical protein SESBI_01690 [Sesbania bispinosa]